MTVWAYSLYTQSMNRNRARLWDFPSAAILVLIVLTASQRLYTTRWAWGLGTAIVLSLIGVVLGMALGFSLFEQRAVYWLTFGFSVPVVIVALGWILYREISWLERVAELSNRLASSIGLFITKQPVQDTVLFVVFIALLFWVIGLMAGYALTRFGNIPGAVVPAGVVFVIIQIFDSGRARGDSLSGIFHFLVPAFSRTPDICPETDFVEEATRLFTCRIENRLKYHFFHRCTCDCAFGMAGTHLGQIIFKFQNSMGESYPTTSGCADGSRPCSCRPPGRGEYCNSHFLWRCFTTWPPGRNG